MKSRDKVLDDMARMAGGGISLLSGLGQQFKDDMRARLDDLALRMDLVPRADFERLEKLLQHTVREVAELRQTLRSNGKKAPRAAAKKKPAKKKARKKS